ncbi:MAG: CdaR family protein [Clostridia bacterium]
MKIDNNFKTRLKTFAKGLFTKNVTLKVVSLIFAMLLWGYVMMDQNPSRVKTVNDVTVSFDGEADLISRKFIVRGDRDEILKNISARISSELTNYADLSQSDVKATVNLRNLSKAGKYTVQIIATTSKGTVLSTNPNTVEVEIDNLVSRRVPLEMVCDKSALPPGHWCGEPELSRSEIEIEGAAQDVANVAKAVCYIDLTERTSSIHESYKTVLLDSNGDPMDATMFSGEMPSVTVNMDIFRTVAMPIDIDTVVLGQDNMPENYIIMGKTASPASITVAGPDELLNEYTKVDIGRIDVSGRTKGLLADVPVAVPDGLMILGNDTVSIYVNIREVRASINSTSTPITIKGLGKRMGVKLQNNTVGVKITGPVSVINELQLSDISAYVDVTNLKAGTYDLDVQVMVKNPETLKMVTSKLTLPKVSVTITG